MVLNLSVPELKELKPKITVIGVGGAGGNAINNMIDSGLAGVDFVAANTDAQALTKSRSDCKIQLGVQITKGLGAGSHPDIGKSSADETKHEIMEHLDGTNMLFITAGMGGGTGTGAAPVIARVAKELGILTVAVVTKPFQFEGAGRMRIAEQGLKELEGLVDTTIVIPNQNLFKVADEKTTFNDAFAMADEVLHAGVRSITDLMVVPGLINLDFADVRTIMNNMGRAMMGTGEAEGENRAIDCAQAAIANPLLDDYSLDGAKGLLINITGGTDLTLFEVDKVTNAIRAEVHPEADVIVGSIFDEKMEGKVRVSVVATGLGPQISPGRRIVDLNVTNSMNNQVSISNTSSMPSVSMEAEEEARIAAEAEEARVAAEAEEEARIAAEAEEEARIAAEAEEARVAAEAEEARVAAEAEEARVAAEAEEEARIAAEAEEARVAAEAEEARVAAEAEEARVAAEAEQVRMAEEIEVEEVIEMPSVIEDSYEDEVIADSLVDEIMPEAEESREEVEDKDYTSIIDLISDTKDSDEVTSSGSNEDAPDLFSTTSETLNNDTSDNTEAKSSETDDDYLEIPAFLRRQSK
jgi:cell division protein FtsZ